MKLEVQNLGPITEGTLRFGDLTVLVGPQASGKSIVLQLLKLLVDTGTVQAELRRYGLDWNRRAPDLIDAYFGEGMKGIWSDKTRVKWNGADFVMQAIAGRSRREKPEELFLIPAQRVLAMRDGWPRPFSDYSSGDPFAVRDFSERLRRLLETEFTGERLFPQERRLKAAFRKLLLKNVFNDYELKIDRVRAQKRLVLASTHGGEALPHMVWSAGQREFIPLLLGLYWLMPPTKVSKRGHLRWVVIEELEMGLHPQAANTVLLMVLELLSRGYRVCLSTHSPQVLEMAWALRNLKSRRSIPRRIARSRRGGEASPTSASVRIPRSRWPLRRKVDEVQRRRRGSTRGHRSEGSSLGLCNWPQRIRLGQGLAGRGHPASDRGVTDLLAKVHQDFTRREEARPAGSDFGWRLLHAELRSP